MKKSHLLNVLIILVGSVFLQACSTLFPSTTYSSVSEDESLESLTKITDMGEKQCFEPNGGEGGKNLVFCAKDQNGVYQIFYKDNVLSPVITQKTFSNQNSWSPSISHDGQKIAFSQFADEGSKIYYINVREGKAITQVTSSEESDYYPCWSSDGKVVVFERGAASKEYITNSINKQTQTNSKSSEQACMAAGCAGLGVVGLVLFIFLSFY